MTSKSSNNQSLPSSHDHDHHDHESEVLHHHSRSHSHDNEQHKSDELQSLTSPHHSDERHHHKDHASSVTDSSQAILRKLYTASALCLTFLIVEAVGGYLAGSLAVLSDAAHLFADLASFAIAIIATKLSALPATGGYTFGLKRMESLAALFSMACLAVVSLGLAGEAIRRLWYLTELDGNVDGRLMFGIAFIGVIVNLILAWVLGEHHVHLPGFDHHHSHSHDHIDDHIDDEEHHQHHDHHAGHDVEDQHGCSTGHGHGHGHDHKEEDQDVDISSFSKKWMNAAHSHGHEHAHGPDHCYGSIEEHHQHGERLEEVPRRELNINLHAAYLHVMGDLAQSVAVLISGVAIWINPDWGFIDPIATLIFCGIVFYSTLGVLKTSVSILLEATPPNMKWEDLYKAISSVEGVSDVHDLHVWSISHGIPSMSVHCRARNPQEALVAVAHVSRSFGIQHASIQVQKNESGPCVTCCVIGQNGCDSHHRSTSISLD